MAKRGHRSAEGRRTGLYLNLTHFPLSVRKYFRHTTKLPLTTREMLVIQQYRFVHGKILPHILPLLSNLQCLQKLLGPTAPKPVGRALHLFQSLSSVTVRRAKNARSEACTLVAGQQQMVWSQRLLTLKKSPWRPVWAVLSSGCTPPPLTASPTIRPWVIALITRQKEFSSRIVSSSPKCHTCGLPEVG